MVTNGLNDLIHLNIDMVVFDLFEIYHSLRYRVQMKKIIWKNTLQQHEIYLD
ncbi:unnamed protein product [Schistosoma margrebowiei]|uniref:Uncharacterized protein n=1 Tax=Schistosoma margrebowiei TaxID=48269 RepID=A0A183LMJ3_9TREM|nr:unnamed protein product [Schistosoma margrebowiei]